MVAKVCVWEPLLLIKFRRVPTSASPKEGSVNMFLFGWRLCSDLDIGFTVVFIIKLEECILVTDYCDVFKPPLNSWKDSRFVVPQTCNVLLDFVG